MIDDHDTRIQCQHCRWLLWQRSQTYCTNHALYQLSTVEIWKQAGQAGLRTSWIDVPRRCKGFKATANE